MATTKKKTEKKEAKVEVSTACNDKFCPWHGIEAVKLRGRILEGEVIKKLHGRVTIKIEAVKYIPKYERYEKRTGKIHARLTPCLDKEVMVGDRVRIGECRPLSKTIHFITMNKITKEEKKQ